MKNSLTTSLLAGSLLFIGAQTAFAAEQTFVIDSTHTFPNFSYSHFGLSTQHSKFSNTQGTVVLDTEKRTGKVDVTIDMTSVQTGFDVFDEHIQGEDFFDTAKYPTATFTGDQVTIEDNKPVAVSGDLTIKGITKPVTLSITNFLYMEEHPMEGKPAIGANAEIELLRSDFGVDKYAPYVSDEVTITISLEAIQE